MEQVVFPGEEDAFDEGFEAFEDGHPEDTNPYNDNDLLRVAWAEGWNAAYIERYLEDTQ